MLGYRHVPVSIRSTDIGLYSHGAWLSRNMLCGTGKYQIGACIEYNCAAMVDSGTE